MSNNYTEEMLEALRANIEYLKTVGDSQLKIRNGELVNEQADLYIYIFELDFFQNLDVDAEIEVRLNNQSASGKVIALNDNKLQVQLDTNLGIKIAEAILIVSSYFLLEKLAEFLEGLKEDGSDLADKTFGLLQPQSEEDEAYTIPTSAEALNNSQSKALRFALGSDVSYIWGPPGTGKTQTIASIIQGLIAKSHSTLLISHTNAATDSALLKVVKHLQDTEDYHEGRFLREGKVSKELAKYKVVPEVILEEKVKPIKDEIEENRKLIGQLEAKLQAHKAAHFMMVGKDDLDEQVNNIKLYLQTKKDEFNQKQRLIRDYISYKERIDSEIAEHQNKGAFSRMFSGTNLSKLTAEKTRILREGKTQKDMLLSLAGDIKSAQAKLKQAEAKATEYEQKFKEEGLLSDQEEAEVEKKIKNLKEQQEKLLNEIEKIKDNLIKEAKVIASTLTMSYTNKKILSREYDCIILDEASMAPLPAIYSAASIAKKKVILVGDFFQLPPIAKHEVNQKNKTDAEIRREEKLVQDWLKRDVFELVGITKAVKQGTEPNILRQLKTQYRMHPDISSLINFLVYSPKGQDKFRLSDGPNTHDLGKERLDLGPLKHAHLGFYNTANIGALPVKTESGSYYNLAQALLCVELAKEGIKSGYETIGIISAYRAQTNLIQKIIQDSLAEEDSKKILADTVHRFQGGERQLIIFDVTTPKSPSMYDDYAEDGDDLKLMNVAFSRAQEKCVIVGDVSAIKKKHSDTSLVKKAIDYCEVQHLPFIAGDDVIPKYLADDRTEQWLQKINLANLEVEVKNSTIFDEYDFYPAFMRDLGKAKQEVVICSPFITTYRVKQFKPYFNYLIDKGVRIFLITKPPDAHKDAMRDVAKTELKNLEQIGVTVLPMIGVHEKVALIDRKILYDGSLNILSQRDSTEMMHRFKGSNVAKQMASFLKIDKNIGALGENNLKHCDVCTSTGSWYWTAKGRYGVWTFCLTGTHAPGKEPKTKKDREDRQKKIKDLRQLPINLNSSGVPVCPVCGNATVLKRGPFSEFYGCREHDYAVSRAKVEKARSAKV